jgi:hypothetical protein
MSKKISIGKCLRQRRWSQNLTLKLQLKGLVVLKLPYPEVTGPYVISFS